MQFLKEPRSTSLHQRLCLLAGDLAQLAGEIFFDRHEYETAQSCYVFAASAAKEAAAYDLWSCALVRHSFLAIYDDRPRYEDGLPLLKESRNLARRGDSELPTRFWVAAVEAESGLGDLTACQNALDRAMGVLSQKEASLAWVRFEGSRLSTLRGACYVRLERPNLAVPALEEALGQTTRPGRKRGMVLIDLAFAATQRRNVEQASSYLDEVINLVALGSSGFLRDGVLKVH